MEAAHRGGRLGEARCRLAVWLVVLPVLLAVAGCGGNGSSPSKTPLTSAIARAKATTTRTSPAITKSGEAGAATPAGSPPSPISLGKATPRPTDLPVASATSTAGASDQSTTASSGLIFATPQGDETIVKNAPTSTGLSAVHTPIPSSFDTNGDGSLSVLEYVKALQARYPTYEWPTGHRLDLNAVVAQVEAQSQKVGMQFENGYERQSLGIAFICAWEYTLLDATYANDSALVAESVERLKTELESNPDLYSDVLKYEEGVISRAQLGDPGPLQQDINGGGCADLPWESGTPEASSVQTPGSIAIQAPAAYRRENDLVQEPRG
jgi:hypothetical protein